MPESLGPADPNDLTVGGLVDFLAPELKEPRWPPDVFVIVTVLLHRSGAYTKVIDSWPPQPAKSRNGRRAQKTEWVDRIREIGLRWRKAAGEGLPIPPEVIAWWKVVLRHRGTAISQVATEERLWQALLELSAAADEASRGAGIPTVPASSSGKPPDDRFYQEAAKLLIARHSLGAQIDPSRILVLPKLHTPQNGITIRSLSHNLAVCQTGDLAAKWWRLPARRMGRSLNLLLVPWPWTIQPRQFKQVGGGITNIPGSYGFFEYESGTGDEAAKVIETLYENAEKIVGTGEIDIVIFPELSLDTVAYERVRQTVAFAHKSLLIAGVADRAKAENYLKMEVPMEDGRVLEVGPQHKHHRWRLEKSQILQYGLGSSLDPTKSLWERISIGKRELHFLALRPWLTLCTLICEDLARQDPVADLIRSVAPNLVVSLLMDGPQLVSRWPARYATVFADDPGCSVLTLTSLGMTTLCRPRGCAASRCVALWKDPRSGGPVEIELPSKASAIVLNLSAEIHPEWTADGRKDYSTTGYPILAGVYPVDTR